MKLIKLGGSLARNDCLRGCLEHIAAHSDEVFIVVPGGGVFADQVRLAQQKWCFDDVAAHHMAILAMQQMAVLINALQPEWRQLSSLNELQQYHSGVAIWFPELSLLNQSDVAASWDVTSDSLAVWLAARMPVTEIILVKAAPVSPEDALASLVQQGVLDADFLHYAAGIEHMIRVVNYQDFLQKNLGKGEGY